MFLIFISGWIPAFAGMTIGLETLDQDFGNLNGV